MLVIDNIKDIRKVLNSYKLKNKSIGLIPTMGALHDGHISLVEKSNEINDISVCSIFINPTQFNKIEDFDNYPSTIKNDIKVLKESDCDIIFLPSINEVYSEKSVLKFDFGTLENGMEGTNRPGHFNGVGLVVSKLFNIIEPNSAFFGQKDFQQLAVIKQLVIDLSFDIDIHSCETYREESGLAMSSRNKRLNEEELKEAAKIHQSLKLAEKLIKGKEKIDVKNEIVKFFDHTSISLEYFEIADKKTLQPINDYSNPEQIVICIAAFLGNVRLIDNIIL